jgi:hypothetical protein
MHKEDVLKFRVGKCGSCSLTMRFWPKDGTQIECPACGCAHEIEVDLAENLKTGEKKEVAWMILVSVGNRAKQLVEKN